MIIFVKLLLAHLLGDFLLQPNSWVLDKESKKHKIKKTTDIPWDVLKYVKWDRNTHSWFVSYVKSNAYKYLDIRSILNIPVFHFLLFLLKVFYFTYYNVIYIFVDTI